MKLLIDHADIDKIREIYRYYPVDGVTTNPSILAAAGRPPFEVLREIRDFIGPDAELHAQVIARDAAGMVKDAKRITKELGMGTWVKIPAVPEGFAAMRELSAEGLRITATAIYTPMQAYLAAKAGALYAAVYINRVDNMGFDGVKVAKEIHDIYTKNGMDAGLLCASFKNSQQVLELAEYGVRAATVGPDVILNFVKNAAITSAVEDFIRDFEGLTGPGKTMSDC
ncbi:MAG: fructose-6-phosphate aldolase [Lachnospiraceae bacterium]|nr:fructose-6-phosphate aldolase [Lachnospiraceae bacterium]MBR2532084.1 fructose-6-phosphate aldolase [Lachnospiraceae bacterium]